jgi:hypothetical protein
MFSWHERVTVWIVDAKRAIAIVIAFCLGLGIGAASLYALRPPPRTVVDPIEVEPARDEDGSRPDSRKTPRNRRRPENNVKDGARSNPDSSGTQGTQDGDDAAPAPPPPAPAGDDDEDGGRESDNDDRDYDDGDE